MLGERIPAQAGARMGPDQPRDRRRRARRRGRRAGGPPGGRPDARVRGNQAPVQRLAVHADGGAAGPRGVDPAAVGGVGRLRGGRAGVPGEAAAPPSPAGERPFPGAPVHILPTPWGRTSRRTRGVAFAGWAQCSPPWSLGALVLAPAASAGWFLPRVRRLAERGRDPHALHPDRADRARDLHRRRGPADLLDVQVPRAQGPRGGADPRQHAARDRLDGRRGGDPDLPDRLHLPPARRHQEPGGLRDRRRGQPGRRQRALRRHRPAGAARGQRER